MKAIQINEYSKQINTVLRDIPLPKISDSEVLIRVKAAAVNPLDRRLRGMCGGGSECDCQNAGGL